MTNLGLSNYISMLSSGQEQPSSDDADECPETLSARRQHCGSVLSSLHLVIYIHVHVLALPTVATACSRRADLATGR